MAGEEGEGRGGGRLGFGIVHLGFSGFMLVCFYAGVRRG